MKEVIWNMKNIKTKKYIMNLLFFLTIFSLYGAMITCSDLDSNPKNVGLSFSFTLTTWVCWLWLPIPILSIVLGYKYRKLGLNCKKNIVTGYIIGILLLLYGSFFLLFPSNLKDYSEINAYKNIINVELPSNGKLELNKWNDFPDSNKTNCQSININYYGENTENIDKNIKQSETWVLSTQVKEILKLFVPRFRSGENIYISVYNETLNEYNTLPINEGNYKIYAMIYDISSKTLQIDEFNYNYK